MPDTTLRDVLTAWDGLRHELPTVSDERLLTLAQQAMALGHSTLACEILRERSQTRESSPGLRYFSALALARIGNLAQASSLVEGLLATGVTSPLPADWLSLAGRIAKDRWALLADGPERQRLGELALAHYRQAWESTGDIFPGINAATMACVTGDTALSRELATTVYAATQLPAQGIEPYWREATLAESAVLLGDCAAARQHYRAAVVAAGRHVGHVASMRRQLKLIGQHRELPDDLLSALELPGIIVFSGHLIDAPDRAQPRFPALLEGAVSEQISAQLVALNAGIGYTSAACGSDLLFIEAMLARGAEVHITLPFDRDDFIATSIIHGGPGWLDRFHDALARATSVTFGVNERYLGDDALFSHAGNLMLGAAMLRARLLETDAVMLAVVDRRFDGKAGGTADLLDQWTRHGLQHAVIDLAILPKPTAPAIQLPLAAPVVAVREHSLRREVRAMLFADMVGYSRLTEEDTPAFLVGFLGAIANLLGQCRHPPAFANTWGDGLYMVFEAVADGADFALQVRDAMRDQDWSAFGLPAGMSIRIGMHSGPVFRAMDPLLGRDNYFGSHVNRAARIEPVAAAGTVCISAEMAYVLVATGDKRFAVDYLGCLPLAKGHGEAPLYRLRRSDATE